jgi:hypothetical protein
MPDADSIIERLSTEQLLYILDHCGFAVPQPAPPPNEGRIGGLGGPACLGADNGATFYVNVETQEVVDERRYGYRGTVLHLAKKVRGLSSSEAQAFIRETAGRAEWDVSREGNVDDKF